MRSVEEDFFRKAAKEEAKKLAAEAAAKAPPPQVQPTPQPQVIVAAPAVQTVEQTSKTWKGRIVLGVFLMFVGIGVLIANPLVGGFIVLGGFFIFVHARFMAWWHHG